MTKTLMIDGMSCMHCVSALTKELEAVGGVSGVMVDLESKTAVVETDGTLTDETLRAAVDEAGYKVVDIV